MEQTSSLFKILIVFALMLGGMRFKLSLGNAFMMGAVVMGGLFGQPAMAIVQSAGQALMDPKTLTLSIVVSLILVLSHSMEKTGQMKRLLGSFRGLIGHEGLNMIIFPALIGLLPMPGGAIFSAPMVKTIGKRHQLGGSQLSYINYWFRHLWEYWWPLYPGVLLTITLAALDLWKFIAFLFPLTLVALMAGYVPLMQMMQRHNLPKKEKTADTSKPGPFFRELAPVLIVIIPGLVIGNLLTPLFKPYGLNVAKETGLIISLVLSIAWTWHVNRLDASCRLEILKSRALLNIFYMVAAILVFKGGLQDCHAVDQVSQEFLRWRIPLVPIVLLLPFIVGIVSGITIAFVGTTFPILISLIQTLGETQLMLPYMMLALSSGFIGVLFSPLHLCLLLSNEYFSTSLVPVYRLMLVPCAVILMSSLLYFMILKSLYAL